MNRNIELQYIVIVAFEEDKEDEDDGNIHGGKCLLHFLAKTKPYSLTQEMSAIKK